MGQKKGLLVGGLAALLTFGGLAGCGDGVDQDNGISDGEQKDQLDQDTKDNAKGAVEDAKQNMKEAMKNVETKMEENNKN
ncbi:hypothetical protein PH210_17765 [Paenibacillus sp. BSR1-1]|uniref:hypothetical protein n=1 Tax=Paenibacillus sp. BSR1-1 TaxID=3020845 RepID=UPI0025AF702C|nr:hypothetical protein [Paenibacillus sp. BSR1-1]MDN3018046.1 hypothetical protein [Paenibacillus sp. BSR1-1]